LCENDSSTLWLKQLFCGGMAGAVAKTVTAPLSRLAMLFQVHSLVSTKGSRNPEYANSLSEAARKVMTREGVAAFWKGNGTSVLHRFPYSAINFAVYEKSNVAFSAALSDAGEHGSAAARFLSGAVAGSSAVVACYPLDLIRTRLTTQQPQTQHAYKGITDAVIRIYKYEGFAGFYSGLSATLCVAVPSFSISYMVYGSLKEYVLDDERFSNFRKIDNTSDNATMTIPATLLCGAASGSLTAIITYPMDVTRRRMQIQAQYVPVSQRMSASKHIKQIINVEGFKGLYRGILPELLKVTPFVGSTFLVYEVLRESFGMN
jgi:hypothetical protein